MPINDIELEPTNLDGWDGHRVWEYGTHSVDAHPDHVIFVVTGSDATTTG